MAPGLQLCFLLVFWSLKNKAVSQKTLQVSPGQNVTLPCNITERIQNIEKVTVEWKRDDSYVVVFRSGKPDSSVEYSQFTDRAELADPELKNGNLSLILRKTQLNDSGVYECRFGEAKSRPKRDTSVPKPITSVTLEVKDVSQKTLEVSPGQNVTLPCTTETIQDIEKVTVEWKRNGSYVVVFRSGKVVSAEQDPQFKNRAEMADPDLKNGTLSMILRNIQASDNGTYECFFWGSGSRKKRSTDDPITSVTLKVKEKTTGSGGDHTETTEGPSLGLTVGLTVGLVVFAVFAAVLGVFIKFRKRRNQKEPTETSAQSVPLSVTE